MPGEESTQSTGATPVTNVSAETVAQAPPAQAAAAAEPVKETPVTNIAPPTKEPAPPKDPVTLDNMLRDPSIAREFKARQQQAIDAAVSAKEQEISVAAERAKMEESDRLRAEKADEAAKRAAAEQKVADLQIDRDFGQAFLKGGSQLANPASIDFVRTEARRVMADEGLPIEACIKDVLEKHAYLLKQDAPASAAAPPPAASGGTPTTEARTTPPTQARHTEAPAQAAPEKTVDTRELTDQEYRKYRRETHGF